MEIYLRESFLLIRSEIGINVADDAQFWGMKKIPLKYHSREWFFALLFH
tara:strand:+ start:385 stop:531 length:147 start_codon:yes stop_codon:yes gene_type:complete